MRRSHLFLAFALCACGSSNQEAAQPGSSTGRAPVGSGNTGGSNSVTASGSGAAPAIALATPDAAVKSLLAVWAHGDPALLRELYADGAQVAALTDCRDAVVLERLATERAQYEERLAPFAGGLALVSWTAEAEEAVAKGKKAGACTVQVEFARVRGKLSYRAGGAEGSADVHLVKLGGAWRIAQLERPLATPPKPSSAEGVAHALLGAIKAGDKAAVRALYITQAQIDAAWGGCNAEQKKIVGDELAALDKNLVADAGVTATPRAWTVGGRKAVAKGGKLNACTALRDVDVVDGVLAFDVAAPKKEPSTRKLKVVLVKDGDRWAVAHNELE
ncbi:MAG: hypothetical protein KF773_23765 [Deltaproteobacteria bacterium]|nr:hypothetical protein [Deltaproteobacteria bacterium]